MPLRETMGLHWNQSGPRTSTPWVATTQVGRDEDGFLDHHRRAAALLAAAGWYGYQGLTVDPDVPISKHGYIAMGLGFVFTLAVGIGLMALLFYSSRAGYDEPPHQIGGPGPSNDE
jgi:hypothetical protein